MFNKILMPLDGSDRAEVVLKYVAELACTFSSDVELVVAVEPEAPAKTHIYDAYFSDVKERFKQMLGVCSGVNISSKILEGSPSESILEYASHWQADLIAIAGHGASGGNPQLLGSIASKILSGSRIPVLMVRGPAPQKSPLLKRILLPLDGSEMSKAALAIVEPLACKLGAKVILFQVVEPIRNNPNFDAIIAKVVLPDDNKIKASAVQYLEGVEASIEQHCAEVATDVVIDSPADGILNYSEADGIDLIAMTTHGYSGIKRWVFGSTTAKVLQATQKPLLLIPSNKN